MQEVNKVEMWYKGQKIEGHYDYVHNDNDEATVLAVFANVVEMTDNSVTVERCTNYGRHRLPAVVKPLWEFQNDYRLISKNEKQKNFARSHDYER